MKWFQVASYTTKIFKVNDCLMSWMANKYVTSLGSAVLFSVQPRFCTKKFLPGIFKKIFPFLIIGDFKNKMPKKISLYATADPLTPV